MIDIQTKLQNLRRPKLLTRAAQAGAPLYQRTRHLTHILGGGIPHNSETILLLLLNREQEMEAQRKAGNAEYRAARHVDVLIALRCEAALWQAAQEEDQVKASGMEAFFSATYAANASLMAGSNAGC